MLNYLSAELWRMSRRGSDKAGWLVFLLLVALAGWLWSSDDPAGVLEAFQDVLPVGLYLAFPLASWANGDASRTGPLVNEVVFGLPRSRIYLGKLLAAVLAGLLLFFLTALAFLGVALPLAARDGWGTWTGDPVLGLAAWATLGRAVVCILPRYVGAVSLAYFLLFTIRPAGVGTVLYYLYITVGEVTLAAVRVMDMGVAGELLNRLAEAVRPFLLSNAYFVFSQESTPPTLENSWLTGALWLFLTTVPGLFLFRRREIR